MKNYTQEILLILVIIGSFMGIIIAFEPLSQNQAYHDFADKRTLCSIPNFFDVTSNIAFALFGIVGFRFCLKNRQKEAPWSWIVFFLGVTMVCFGSGYYHWNPNDNSLVWDRFPMTIGFMGLFIGILSEYVNSKIERFFLIPAIISGFSSWFYFDDLRFYYWIQLIPLLIIPVVLIVYQGKYTHQRYLIFALSFYLLAKVSEAYDKEIFFLSYEQFSGHSLKHLLASLGPLTIYMMFKKREVVGS
jgi:hypothetical protein